MEIGNPSVTLIIFMSSLLGVWQDGFPWVLHSLSALSFSVREGDEKADLFFSFWLHPPHGMWDLGSPTRDGTCAPCMEGRVLITALPGKSQEGRSFIVIMSQTSTRTY